MKLVAINDVQAARPRIATVVREYAADTFSTTCRSRSACAIVVQGGAAPAHRVVQAARRLQLHRSAAGRHPRSCRIGGQSCARRGACGFAVRPACHHLHARTGLPAQGGSHRSSRRNRRAGRRQTIDDAVRGAKRFARRTRARYVPPFDDRQVIAGQGTVALEIIDQLPTTERATIVVPVGGGGLIAGIAVAVRALRPLWRVVGVEAQGAASMRLSLDAGVRSVLPAVATIADGIALKSPSELTLAHVQALVDDVVTVSDEEIGRALSTVGAYEGGDGAERCRCTGSGDGRQVRSRSRRGARDPVVVVLSGATSTHSCYRGSSSMGCRFQGDIYGCASTCPIGPAHSPGSPAISPSRSSTSCRSTIIGNGRRSTSTRSRS